MIQSRLELKSGIEKEFLWATGIEDTFIIAVYQKTGRSLDEYELTDHYNLWNEDFVRMKELGVRTCRYGIPWHRIQPAPGVWDWNWTDQVIDRLLKLEIQPIVDLVHYGVPAWIFNAYLNPDFPDRMAEYAWEVANRYRGQLRWFTPFNEPRIAAWYCGRLGWWPPFQRSWKGFAKIILQIARGVIKTHNAILDADSENILVHVDATDLYFTGAEHLQSEVEKRQQIVFLALDLIHGFIDQSHPLYTWLSKLGIQDNEFQWFRDHSVQPDIMGINLYPMFTWKQLHATNRGVRFTMPYASGSLVEELSRMYWDRYKKPIMVTETASLGSVRRRRKWMEDSVAAVRSLRMSAIPVIGYTWWPMFSLVAWAFRQGTKPMDRYLLHMGLWDLDPREGALVRQRTPLVDRYHEFTQSGTKSVSNLQAA